MSVIGGNVMTVFKVFNGDEAAYKKLNTYIYLFGYFTIIRL